jgi:hypothetical protein
MKNQSPMPLTIRLDNLRIVVSPPDFKLTPEQEAEIAKWWHDRLERSVRRTTGLPDVD